ncbi:50S ribosomal protein L2 [Sandarakinorhabdus sp.]|jgi:large subunit ribosomal protein L2|uniref:50S ribosomal protein L2 n=1 Tax=Sandarakinorhabdus sp. TaxID=1916663 RepID=UPI0033408074
MALKSYNPTSPGQRGLILVDRSALFKGRPLKTLTEGLKKTGGRNNKGHATARGIGGGHKRLYRVVDFKRRLWDVAATVERLEYDPNRSAFIALVKYADKEGTQAYIIAPQRLNVGDSVIAGKKVDVKPGNAMEIGQMPVGTIVHNVELKPGKGGQMARAAGTFVQVVGRDKGMVIIRLNSGEQRYVRSECMATVGAVSNPDNSNQNLGKAGRNRWLGYRPLTRGVAKNPVDHPHGGGEGRTSGGRHPVTPWGKPTKGMKTRSNKATDHMIIRSRHAKKKR